MKTLTGYLKEHRAGILLFLLCLGITALIFYLYALPGEAFAYAAALCFTAGLLTAVAGYLRYRCRHSVLSRLQQQISVSTEGLPAPRNLTEEDYTALLEILNRDKRRMQAEHEASARDMSDYFTLWAHQIKTPLAAMRLLLQGETCSRTAELQAELFKTEQYTEMVLSYLRTDSESTDYLIQNYSLEEIVRKTVRKHAPLFIQTATAISIAPISETVLTDEKWLSFLIGQIISNAVKYGRGQVSVYPAENKTLVIEDNGIGIAAEDLPRIFEKGFTGYNGRIDRRATGLGLYLCRRIADRLGHKIRITSEIGVGTKVFLDLSSARLEVE